MKANEIRIGNVFTPKGFPMYVEAIFKDTVYLNFEGNEGDIWEEDIKDLVPIPVTEEILMKCGFEKIREGGFLCGKIFIHFDIVDNHWCFMYSSCYLRSIIFVHQLQNLFFALTGEEIKIEL